jgi:3-mercaptopyruvate sulfurtransferase SseA
MKINLLSVSTLLLATLACSTLQSQTEPRSAQTPPVTSTQAQGDIPQSEAGVPRVTIKDAKAAFDSGDAIFVDVRSAEAYAGSHITGAISIPLGEFESNIANVTLDKNKWIITYCT